MNITPRSTPPAPTMSALRVFVLEDSADRVEALEQRLPGASITVAASYDDARKVFAPPYDLICLDHDLGRWHTLDPTIENTGLSFVRYGFPDRSATFAPTIFVHTASLSGATAMARELRQRGHEPFVTPFGDEMLAKVMATAKGWLRQ